jgi:DNA-binding transcriptional ArsR family regulator
MTAGQLAGRFSHSWPTTTRHLRELEAAGLVGCEARGRERHYVLNRDHLLRTTELWLRVFR